MGYGPAISFNYELTSGATLGSALDLGRAWEKVYLKVPTMASGDLFIHGSEDSSSTFKRVCVDNLNTSTAQIDFKIPSSVTNRIVPIPNYFRYIKIESSSGCTDVTSVFKVIVGG
jgi:hypothetical protein